MGCGCGGKRYSTNASKVSVNNIKNQQILKKYGIQGQRNVRNIDYKKEEYQEN
ncbi:hypothetical protein QE429_004733 [Bacillus sp. SORGH_AS 510]|uniref:hypothetical protein n=1 Tax=Bacillus sp. SORGH_AS_0510 TaxID=3041771 RepID=UPI00278022CC|nr:hypothetical protein [Bacillus sp. SORGH_AS_0510]MDQ1147906.1 hypothetical protein [Bacillus sp. SORGH_AS_0510]